LASCTTTPAPSRTESRSDELTKARIFEAFAAPCSLDTPPNSELPSDAPEPPTAARPEPGPFTPGVFLDTALFLLPTARAGARLPASSESLAHDPSVRLLGTPHLSAHFDAKSRMVLADNTGPLAQTAFREFSATPKRTEDAQLAIEIDLVLQLPSSQTAPAKPPESRIHLLTAPHFSQPVVLTAQVPEQPGQSLLFLLTPYPLRSEADLRAIFLCKMAQRERAMASTR
jgi:hypothetical protein